MPYEPSINLADDLKALKQEFDQSYRDTPVASELLTNELCWKRLYGGATRHGQEVLIPYSPWSGRAKKKNPFEKVRGEFQDTVNFKLAHYLRGPETGRIVDVGTKLSIVGEEIEKGIEEMMPAAMLEYDFDFAELIGKGTTAINSYDNLPHFSTSHLANPKKAALGTFSNYSPTQTLDRAGLIKIFDLMNRRPWFDGRVRKYTGKYIVLCSNEDQYQRAAENLLTSIRAGSESSTGSVASTDNTLQGRAEVRLFNELADHYGNKAWMVVRVVNGTVRPFILSIVTPPFLKFEGELPSDHLNVVQSSFLYTWEAMWGMGYADPRYSHLCIEP